MQIQTYILHSFVEILSHLVATATLAGTRQLTTDTLVGSPSYDKESAALLNES
jgi:hypothetical protein